MSLNYCARDGLICPATEVVPDDPGDFYIFASLDLIGCNNLVCDQCGAKVRHHDNLWPANNRPLDEAALYNTPDWTQSDQLVPASRDTEGFRLYACRCGAMVVANAQTMASFADRDKIAPPWRCAGHPVAELPMQFVGANLAPDTDWDAIVLSGLHGVYPHNPTAFEKRVPEAFVVHLYIRLIGTPYAEAVSRAVARLFASPDPILRVHALHFFSRLLRVPGWETLVPIARAHPELYGPEQAPKRMEGVTMHNQLLKTFTRLGLSPDGDPLQTPAE